MDTSNLTQNEYTLLESLANFPRRRDDSGRYKMGRAIKPFGDDEQTIQDFLDQGCINIGFDYKTKKATISITEHGEQVYQHNRNFRLLQSGRLSDRIRAAFSEVVELF
ncbi:MAG TPA: hypothetical protein VMC80_00850 [Patescibacteria group bacterium]|nr:hypothetical protein [Patescibacteria group bacterium]